MPHDLATQAFDDQALLNRLIHGFYPEFMVNPLLDPSLWFGSYIATYLEKDLRNLKAIRDLSRFQTFLSLLATRAGSLLNLSELAKECGITQPTARDWVAILEATYVIYLLRPYYKNKTKRLVKSPKLYFIDTGLLCYLLGIDTSNRLMKATERGHIFENMVIMDRLKTSCISPSREVLSFYRTQHGSEVDLIIEKGGITEAIEIKFSKTPTPKMGDSLQRFVKEHSDVQGKLLCLREDPLPLSRDISTFHWRSGY